MAHFSNFLPSADFTTYFHSSKWIEAYLRKVSVKNTWLWHNFFNETYYSHHRSSKYWVKEVTLFEGAKYLLYKKHLWPNLAKDCCEKAFQWYQKELSLAGCRKEVSNVGEWSCDYGALESFSRSALSTHAHKNLQKHETETLDEGKSLQLIKTSFSSHHRESTKLEGIISGTLSLTGNISRFLSNRMIQKFSDSGNAIKWFFCVKSESLVKDDDLISRNKRILGIADHITEQETSVTHLTPDKQIYVMQK